MRNPRRCIRYSTLTQYSHERTIMEKYVLGWILGAPMVILVALYFFVH
ncbi:hypothetical protein SAMN04515618_101620 [Collimonas sp. OK307]|nr:hypothetical protein SAMN04515618_101620 [Collimonas sp. OK307]